jgi:hypothetical protein
MGDSPASPQVTLLKFCMVDKTIVTLDKEIAIRSEFIDDLLEHHSPDETDEPIVLGNESVTEANFTHLFKYIKDTLPYKDNDDTKLKEIREEFVNVPDKLLFGTLLLSNYLNPTDYLNTPILDMLCKHVAELIKECSSPEEIRRRFSITNDFTPEEEREAMDEVKSMGSPPITANSSDSLDSVGSPS